MMEEEDYFRTIEDHFLQKRGNPLLLSPKEWILIREWYDQSIPEDVILRAIDRAFEKKAEDKLPLSLRYAGRLVKSEHKKYIKSLEGKDPAKHLDSAPEAKNVGEFLQRLAQNLERSRQKARESGNNALSEYLEKNHQRLSTEIVEPFFEDSSPDLQRVEHQLTTLEKEIEQILLQMISEEQINLFKEDAMRELKMFEAKLDLAVYQEMLSRALIKSVRRFYHIPRLSLFYM